MSVRKGFTLIELLVVIAIIAILAAILFPVFNAAKRAAYQTQSSSNAKQIVLAATMYSNDNDDLCPPVYTHGPMVNGGGQDIIYADQILMSYVKSEKIWASSVDDAKRNDPVVGNYTWAYNDGDLMKKQLKRSYAFVGNIMTKTKNGYDPDTGMGVGFPSGYWDQPGRSLTSYEKPAETAMLVEAWSPSDPYNYVGSIYYAAVWNCWSWMLPGRPKDYATIVADLVPASCTAQWDQFKSNPGYAKSKGVYAFADGHVGLLTWDRAVADEFEVFRAVNKKS
ncbi:MAG: prepilin-type N-terminal cleavage/methylation domain-containing protein [Armatimonadetes bacterium]|nr:prepilin-type N-terminal cleavage/methylation domain-containing protein [Armatimonadota bacterium]